MARSLISEEAMHWNLLTGVWTPGKVIYVDAAANGGSDSNSGLLPTDPYLTINGALSDLCTANQGDVIQVLGNSPSTPNDTGTITMNKGGVTLRGLLGRGIVSDSGFAPDAQNTACITIAANFVTVENLFLGTHSTGSNGGIVEFTGSPWGFTLRNCMLGTQYVAAYGIYDEIGTDLVYMLIEDCIFGSTHAPADNFTDCIYLGHNATGTVIRRNLFRHYSGVGINVISPACNFAILDNRFYMPSDADGSAITLADGTSGISIDGNHAFFGTANPTDPYRDVNGDDDSNAWGLNYKGITATLAKMT